MRTLSIALVALSLISVPASATETRMLTMNSDENDWVGKGRDYHIRSALQISGPARLAVFDVAGRRVAVIVDRTLEAGWHDVEWTLSDERGRRVNSGIYFLNLKSTAGDKSRSLIIVR